MRTAAAAVAALIATLYWPGGTPGAVSPARQAGGLPPLLVDLAVVDPAGSPAAGVAAADLRVEVDGLVRPVLGLRPAAASERLVLLVVDEASFPPAAAGSVAAMGRRFAASLAPETRAGLLVLPFASPRLVITSDRAALARDLDGLRGRGPSDLQVAGAAFDETQPTDDRRPAGARGVRPETEGRLPGEAARTGGYAAANPAASWAPLQRVLSNLRKTPGPKTVVVFFGAGAGASGPSSAEMRALFSSLAASAQAARTAIDIVLLPTGHVTADRPDWLEELASATGGLVVDARGDPDAPGRILAPKVMAGYVAEIEAAAGDRDGRPREIAVTAPARRGRLFTARRIYPEGQASAPVPGAPAASPTPAAQPPNPAAPAASAAPTSPPPAASRTAPPRKPDAEALLNLAGRYLAEYEQALSSVVAEEDYVQRLNRQLSVVSQMGSGLGSGVDYSVLERHLRSDFLLVRGSQASGWVPFRDVYEVDGRAVRDRADRLRTLFIETPAAAFDQARRVMLESARYNLGDVARTINIPTLPLLFVDPRHRDRFAWKKAGGQTIEGVRAERLDFEEQERPTLVRSSRNLDVPLLGTLWIDPGTGRLVKGTVRVQRTRREVVEMTVVFRPNDALGVWVPAEMTEFYQIPGQTLDATAKYSNFRRFQVKTEEKIAVPK